MSLVSCLCLTSWIDHRVGTKCVPSWNDLLWIPVQIVISIQKAFLSCLKFCHSYSLIQVDSLFFFGQFIVGLVSNYNYRSKLSITTSKIYSSRKSLKENYGKLESMIQKKNLLTHSLCEFTLAFGDFQLRLCPCWNKQHFIKLKSNNKPVNCIVDVIVEVNFWIIKNYLSSSSSQCEIVFEMNTEVTNQVKIHFFEYWIHLNN